MDQLISYVRCIGESADIPAVEFLHNPVDMAVIIVFSFEFDMAEEHIEPV